MMQPFAWLFFITQENNPFIQHNIPVAIAWKQDICLNVQREFSLMTAMTDVLQFITKLEYKINNKRV